MTASCPPPATARPLRRPAPPASQRPGLATGIALAATAAALLDLQLNGLPETAVHIAVAVVVFITARWCAAWSLAARPPTSPLAPFTEAPVRVVRGEPAWADTTTPEPVLRAGQLEKEGTS